MKTKFLYNSNLFLNSWVKGLFCISTMTRGGDSSGKTRARSTLGQVEIGLGPIWTKKKRSPVLNPDGLDQIVL